MNKYKNIAAYAAPFVLLIIFSFTWYEWGKNEYSIFKYITGTSLKKDYYQTTGTWGDTYGALNALISALGFVGIIFTISMQYVANANQKIDLHKQRFESTIFEQIRLIRETRDEIIFVNSATKNKYHGRDATRQVERYLIDQILSYRATHAGAFLPKERLATIYSRGFHSRFESRVGAFFRVVYYTFDKIRSDKFLTDEEKRNYGNLIRGQLTSADVAILGVNALTKYSNDLEQLVIYFRLLRYMGNSVLKNNLKEIFPPETFIRRG
ncbi:putative phage abortive infection protein [Komagataeibacter sp. NFXK3]